MLFNITLPESYLIVISIIWNLIIWLFNICDFCLKLCCFCVVLLLFYIFNYYLLKFIILLCFILLCSSVCKFNITCCWRTKPVATLASAAASRRRFLSLFLSFNGPLRRLNIPLAKAHCRLEVSYEQALAVQSNVSMSLPSHLDSLTAFFSIVAYSCLCDRMLFCWNKYKRIICQTSL